MRTLLLLATLAAGCAAPLPTQAPATPTRFAVVPSEAVHYGLAEEADAGFVRLRVETQPCGEGLTGVKIRLANTGSKIFEIQEVRSVTVDSSGNELLLGDCGGTVSFGGTPLTAGVLDIFLAKYRP